jgi:7-cyano-7-deazaguanine synthase
MAKDIAIVLNNGSVSSAVTAALAGQKYRPVMLYAEVGDAVGARQRAAYDQQVGHFKPYREHTLAMPFFAGVIPVGGAGVDPRADGDRASKLMDLLPLVACAGRFAAHYQASAVYLGLRVGPGGEELAAATEYGQVLNELLQIPCGEKDLEIVMPILELEAWQVVDVAHQVGAPMDKTWSCSEQGAEPCGTCRGCRNREAAFAQAGRADPLRAGKRV